MKASDLLGHPRLYRLWQAPFVNQKLRPVEESGVLSTARKVLDVGCGPGTNSAMFASAARYVGVDISERYISYASKHFDGEFRVVDVTSVSPSFGQFDLILLNSLMHHLDDESSRNLLRSLPSLLESGGQIHIIDLVLADEGVRRAMALADRGDFPRTMAQWRAVIQPILKIGDMRTFDVGLGPLRLWQLVHVRAFAHGV